MNKLILILAIIIILIVGIGGYFLLKGNYQNPSYNNQPSNTPNNQQTPQGNTLDLSNQGLTKIPEYVFNQTNLEELNVSNNSLTGAIQSQIGQLKNIRILNASNNQMTGVPAEVGQLQKLEVLDLSNNKLTGLPNELANLKNLKTLNLSGNQYSQQDLNTILKGLPTSVNVITSQQPVTKLPSKTDVSIKNFAFNPGTVIINAGTIVVWTNNDPMAHRIKSDTFNSNNLNQGDTFQFKFDNKGTYNYSCAIHPSMTGKIIVE